jgi:hypothetical protein
MATSIFFFKSGLRFSVMLLRSLRKRAPASLRSTWKLSFQIMLSSFFLSKFWTTRYDSQIVNAFSKRFDYRYELADWVCYLNTIEGKWPFLLSRFDSLINLCSKLYLDEFTSSSRKREECFDNPKLICLKYIWHIYWSLSYTRLQTKNSVPLGNRIVCPVAHSTSEPAPKNCYTHRPHPCE